jgi:hypothetical protein
MVGAPAARVHASRAVCARRPAFPQGAGKSLSASGCHSAEMSCAQTAIMPTNSVIDANAAASSTKTRNMVPLLLSPEHRGNIVPFLFRGQGRGGDRFGKRSGVVNWLEGSARPGRVPVADLVFLLAENGHFRPDSFPVEEMVAAGPAMNLGIANAATETPRTLVRVFLAGRGVIHPAAFAGEFFCGPDGIGHGALDCARAP